MEHAFFLEDGERDPAKFNRYYFNFPQEWCTSNRGESIIGVRNIFMLARKRRLEFKIKVRKYYKEDYNKHATPPPKSDDPNLYDHSAYINIPARRKSMVEANVITWMSEKDDFSGFGFILYKFLWAEMKKYNQEIEDNLAKAKTEEEKIKLEEERIKIEEEKAITEEEKAKIEEEKAKIEKEKTRIEEEKAKYKDKPRFSEDPYGLSTELDVMADGFYDYKKKTYLERILSRHNYDKKSPYYIDISIDFPHRTVEDFGLIDRKYDFEDVFNISGETDQGANYHNNYKFKWLREVNFYNVWDRHSCKIYSSFGDQSNQGYVGNTTIYFNPIKYFKLNSTDQRFWIELYSGRHKDIPVKIPRSESFSIEMIFFPYRKMLY